MSTDRKTGLELQRDVRRLSRLQAPRTGKGLYFVPEAPFDRELLNLSTLYRKSRLLFLNQEGVFRPALLSSERTLGNASLLENQLTYSPIESEIRFRVENPIERKRPETLARLRLWSTNLFHEQNHRILWNFLPPAQAGKHSLRHFLHLAEALVVVTDMALGDELGSRLAGSFYRLGVTYDPGTELLVGEKLSLRGYRNYLQIAMRATYLYLEHFPKNEIASMIERLFPDSDPRLRARASERALNLDPKFVFETAPRWYLQNKRHAEKILTQKAGDTLPLSANPLNPVHEATVYLQTERWFDMIGIDPFLTKSAFSRHA